MDWCRPTATVTLAFFSKFRKEKKIFLSPFIHNNNSQFSSTELSKKLERKVCIYNYYSVLCIWQKRRKVARTLKKMLTRVLLEENWVAEWKAHRTKWEVEMEKERREVSKTGEDTKNGMNCAKACWLMPFHNILLASFSLRFSSYGERQNF